MLSPHKYNTRFKKKIYQKKYKSTTGNKNTNTNIKKNNIKKSNIKKLNNRLSITISSDDSSHDDSEIDLDSDSDSDYQEDSENYDSTQSSNLSDFIEESDDEENLDKYKYAKFLNKIFPSSYSKDKINQLKRRRLISPKSINNNINSIVAISNKILDKKNNKDEYDDNACSELSESNNSLDSQEDIYKNLASKLANKIVDKLDKELHRNSDSNSDSNSDNDSDNDSGIDCESELDYQNEFYDNNDYKDVVNNDLEKTKKKPIRQENYKNKNFREYKKIFKLNKNNENEYFKENLSQEQQLDIINKLKNIKSLSVLKKPYLIHLAELNIPDSYKVCAINKINVLNSIDEDSVNGEYYKLKNWIDNFMKIPFDNYCKIPVHISDGLEKCNEFLINSKKILDDCVYGLENAKLQIIQLLGLWIVNPDSIGSSIAIKGPMGVGKTTLIKEGVSKVLQRYFMFVALGGANDISHFEGHGYTYEGCYIW